MTATATQTRSLPIPQTAIKALDVLARAINRHTNIPILQNMFVQYDGRDLTLTTTDLEVRATYRQGIGGCSAFDFSTTIPFQMFRQHVKGAKDVSIVDYSGGDSITVIADGMKRKFPTLPADEFPPGPSRGFNTVDFETEVPFAQFLHDVARVSAVAAEEQARGALLMSTKIEVDNGMYNVIGTDGYRLGFVHREVTSFNGGAGEAALPAGLAHVLGGIKPGKKDEAAARVIVCHKDKTKDEQMAFIITHEWEIQARCVDGQYPNYLQVIPSTLNSGRMIVNRKALRTLVTQAEKCATGFKPQTHLSTKNDTLTVTAASDAGGKFEANLRVENQKFPSRVLFDGKFLGGILGLLDAEEVCMVQRTALSPLQVFNGTAECNEYYLLMPLKA